MTFNALRASSPARSPLATITMAALIAIAALMATTIPALAKKSPVLPQPGDVLVAGGVTSNGKSVDFAQFYRVSTGQFINTGNMTAARAGEQAIALPIQKEVLVTGGFQGSAKLQKTTLNLNFFSSKTAELYNPANNRFAATAMPMTDNRSFFAYVLFPTEPVPGPLAGQALLIAGLCNGEIRKTAELFDPATGLFTAISDLNVTRYMHTATLLQNGTVLVTGGITELTGTVTNSAEVFDPTKGSFTTLATSMNTARAGHTATLLSDGTVLIAGGFTGSGGTLTAVNSAESFNPTTQIFTPLVSAPMNEARAWHTATLLADGMTVLIAGGFDGVEKVKLTGTDNGDKGTLVATGGTIRNTAEIYNADAGTPRFTCVGGAISGGCAKSMAWSHFGHTATLLNGGNVLVVGGFGGPKPKIAGAPLNHAEIFNPMTESFKAAANMNHPRAWHAAALIP